MLAPAHPDGQRDSDTASFFHVQDCSTLPQSGNSSFESGVPVILPLHFFQMPFDSCSVWGKSHATPPLAVVEDQPSVFAFLTSRTSIGDQHATRRESGVAAFVRPALRSLLARKKGEAVQNITTCKLSALPMRREAVRPLMNGKGNDQGAAIGCSVLTFKFCREYGVDSVLWHELKDASFLPWAPWALQS